MAFTTRTAKGSPLNHSELDANFTTLGVANGDTDISGLISTVFDQNKTWGQSTDHNRFNSAGSLMFLTHNNNSAEFIGDGYTKIQSNNNEVDVKANSWVFITPRSGDTYIGQSIGAGDAHNNWLYLSTSNSDQQMNINVTNANSKIAFQNNIFRINSGSIEFSSLPTTNPNNPGQLWNDNGTVKIS